MKQPRQEDVNVAIPKAGCHDKPLAVDDSRTARNLDLCDQPNRRYVAVMHKNRAVFNRWLIGGEIDLRIHQGQVGPRVGRMALESSKKSQNQEKR